MKEDIKTVLRAMLTQFGKGNKFSSHGERDRRLSGKRGNPALLYESGRDLICPGLLRNSVPTHPSTPSRTIISSSSEKLDRMNNQIKCITVQYYFYKHLHWCACATWFSTRMTTYFIRAFKRGPRANRLLFHVTSRGDESIVCHVPRQKRVGTESNNSSRNEC